MSGRNASVATSEQPLPAYDARVREVRRATGNGKCADCGDPGPPYAVVSIGVLVCPRCSGLHRELGHRVKSLTLSTLTSAELGLLEAMGNRRADDVWLADARAPRPSADALRDTAAARRYVHQKYAARSWFSLEALERVENAPAGAQQPVSLDDVLGADTHVVVVDQWPEK